MVDAVALPSSSAFLEMGAVAGVFCLDGSPVACDLLRNVMSTISSRTGARFDVFDGDFIALGLGHYVLSAEQKSTTITRLPDGSIVACDGRVDERSELALALGLGHAERDALNDGELLARAWLRWRGDFWKHVVGDFALAVWERSTETLLLFRDRFGVRPIYTIRTPSLFAFASEHTALLGLPGVKPIPNEDRIANLLIPGFDVGAAYGTWFNTIDRVDPASTLQISRAGRMHSYAYWIPEPGPELKLGDEREYIDAFQDVLERAVRCRIPARGLAAVQLSGGIDSASLLAAAGNFKPLSRLNPLGAISVLPDASVSEEVTNIRQMLGAVGGMAIGFPESSSTSLSEAFDAHLWHQPDPLTASAPLVVLSAMAAAEAGVGVLMDGLDGDMLMSASYGYIARMIIRGRLAGAWEEASLAAMHHTHLWGRSPLDICRISARAWLGELAGRILPKRARFQRRFRATFGAPDVLLNPDFVARCQERFEELSDQLDREPHCYATLLRPGLTAGAGVYGRVAAAFGVDVRHPWLDQRVVDFTLRLPEHLRVNQGWTKYLARRASEPSLGRQVVWHRGKEHLGTKVLVQQMTRSKRLHSALEGSLPALSPYLNVEELRKLQLAWKRDTVQKVPDSRLYYAAALGGWIQRYAC